jgi:hypothetical protein
MCVQVAATTRDSQVEKKTYHVGENVLNDAVILKFLQDDKDGQNAD